MRERGPGQAIAPARRVEGELRVPGDKSISHRALLVGAMGHGTMAIAGLSPAADVASTLRALRGVGVLFSKHNAQVEGDGSINISGDFQILVEGQGVRAFTTPEGTLDVGNSGTTLRLLLGILAGGDIEACLSGDISICRRPMGRVVEPLRVMGAQIDGEDGGQRAPLRVRGARLHGAEHLLAVASAQVKSALLFAGLLAEGETSVTEPFPSRDHTERMLEYLGVHISRSVNRLSVKSTEIQNSSITIPGDLSSAAFHLVAAAILPDSEVRVIDVGVNPTRAGILDILRAYGAQVQVTDVREVCGEPVGTVTVRSGDRRPLDVSGALTLAAIDELPLVAVLGACAEGGVTMVRDAAELRVKESDRLAAIAQTLRRMGVGVETMPDGFAVHGSTTLTGATIDPMGDHRIAMAAAVGALAAQGDTLVEDWGCVGVSYPGFEEDLTRLAVR